MTCPQNVFKEDFRDNWLFPQHVFEDDFRDHLLVLKTSSKSTPVDIADSGNRNCKPRKGGGTDSSISGGIDSILVVSMWLRHSRRQNEEYEDRIRNNTNEYETISANQE